MCAGLVRRLRQLETALQLTNLQKLKVASELGSHKLSYVRQQSQQHMVGQGLIKLGNQLLDNSQARFSGQQGSVSLKMRRSQAKKMMLALKRIRVQEKAERRALKANLTAMQQNLDTLVTVGLGLQQRNAAQNSEVNRLNTVISRLSAQLEDSAALKQQFSLMEKKLTENIQGLQSEVAAVKAESATLKTESAAMKAQQANEQRAKELLESQGALLAELRYMAEHVPLQHV